MIKWELRCSETRVAEKHLQKRNEVCVCVTVCVSPCLSWLVYVPNVKVRRVDYPWTCPWTSTVELKSIQSLLCANFTLLAPIVWTGGQHAEGWAGPRRSGGTGVRGMDEGNGR